MKRSKLGWAVILATVVLTAPTAFGQTYVWEGDDLVDPTSWDIAENWQDIDFDGTGDIPGAGADVNFVGSAGQTIDLMGVSRSLGNVLLENMNDAAVFQSTGGAATLGFVKWEFNNNKSQTVFDVDLDGGLLQNIRKSDAPTFNGSVKLSDPASGPGQRTWTFANGAEFTNGLDFGYRAIAIGGNPAINANSAIVLGGQLTIRDNAAWNANDAAGLGDSGDTVVVQTGGSLWLNTAQTSLANITVKASSLLTGDVTGATYGAGGNVTLEEDAVLAVTAGPEPTLVDMPTTKIWQGVAATGTHVAPDSTTTVYKGLAIGTYTPSRWGPSQNYQGLAGENLTLAVSTNATEEYDRADLNADTGVANLNLYGSSAIRLGGDWLEGTATEIHVRNEGNVNRLILQLQNKGPNVGQELHAHDGQVQLQNTAAASNIKGRLELHGESMLWLSTDAGNQIVPDAGTEIVFNDVTALDIDTGKVDVFEQLTLGTTLIDNSTELLVALNSSGGYDFPGTVSGVPNPVIQTLLPKANYGIHVANNQNFVLPADLTLGDGKYFIDTSGSHKSIFLGDGVAAGKIVAAAGASSIGLANMSGNGSLKVNATIDGGGTAAIRIGSASSINAVKPGNTRLSAVPTGAVQIEAGASFDNTPEVSVESGTLRANTAFTFETDLALNGGNFHLNNQPVTVEGTLKGSGGSWSNGTITIAAAGSVAPGDSVGTLAGTGGILLEDDATLAIDFLDPAGVAGAGWDLLSAGSLDFDIDDTDAGTINVTLMNAGMTTAITSGQQFAVAVLDNGVIDEPGNWSITGGLGWDTTAASLLYVADFADIDGDTDLDDCLVLSGVKFSIFDPTDFDQDGDTDLDDVDLLTAEANLPVGLPVALSDVKFDISGNEMVDSADLDKWLTDAATVNGFASAYLKGDANLDGDVDVWAFDGSGDAQVLSENLGTMTGMVWSDGDFNGDGDVDVWAFDGSGDAQQLSSNLGATNDAAEGTAEAIYNAVTGELSFDIGEGVAVVGIQADGMKHGDVDSGSPLGGPGQNAGNVLAYFNAAGLTAGMSNVGAVLPTGLTAGDIAFAYTPVGGATTAVAVTVIVPEPSTIAMLLVLGGIALCWRRRRA